MSSFQVRGVVHHFGNLRRLVLPRIDASLTNLPWRLVETGGRLVKHARHYWLPEVESHLTRRLFESMLPRLPAPRLATVSAMLGYQTDSPEKTQEMDWCLA